MQVAVFGTAIVIAFESSSVIPEEPISHPPTIGNRIGDQGALDRRLE